MFTFTVIAALLCIATGFNAIATTISWRRAKAKFGFYFAMGMTSVTFWTLTSVFDYAAVPIPWKVFFAKWEYIFYHADLAFFLLFFLYYGGYVELAESRLLRTALWIGCGINVLLAWTNDWHGWLWSGFSQGELGNNTIIFEHGPAYLWVLCTGYLLYGSVLLAAWLASRRGSTFGHQQGRILFYAFLFPLLGNLVYQFEPPELKGMDWASIFATLSSIVAVWALYGTRLLDIAPIAREKLMESLGDGMLVLDLQGRIVDVNPAAGRMIDSPSEKLLGRNVRDVLPSIQPFEGRSIEREIRTELEIGDAEKRYFDVLVSPLLEGGTVVVGHLIIFRDITVRKQNELRLLQLNQAVEQSPMSVVITDPNGNITYVNSRFTTLTGYTLHEAQGKNPRILQSGQTPPDVYRSLWQTIKAGKVWKGEFLNKKKNGELYWEDATIAPVVDHNGRILNFIAAKENITERKHAQDELQKLARTDSLTGLFNRRHFFEIAEREFAKSIRYHRPLSVILFDIDYFKDINDTYGHSIGDQALIQIGKLLLEKGRQTDLAARYGGEEFIILLTETEYAEAKVVAERLRKLMEELSIQTSKGDVRFTASFGVAGKAENIPSETLDRLISQADQTMYEAKRMGRNRVV